MRLEGQVGDLLIVIDGRYRIGTTALLTEHNVRGVIQSHLSIINTLKREQLDPYELLYALNDTLERRSALLADLQAMAGPEYEL